MWDRLYCPDRFGNHLSSVRPPGSGRGPLLRRRCVSIIPDGGKCQSRQRRKRLGAGLLHDRGTMVLDGTLADAKIRGDVLAGVPGQDPLHDLALPPREASDVARRILM